MTSELGCVLVLQARIEISLANDDQRGFVSHTVCQDQLTLEVEFVTIPTVTDFLPTHVSCIDVPGRFFQGMSPDASARCSSECFLDRSVSFCCFYCLII